MHPALKAECRSDTSLSGSDKLAATGQTFESHERARAKAMLRYLDRTDPEIEMNYTDESTRAAVRRNRAEARAQALDVLARDQAKQAAAE